MANHYDDPMIEDTEGLQVTITEVRVYGSDGKGVEAHAYRLAQTMSISNCRM